MPCLVVLRRVQNSLYILARYLKSTSPPVREKLNSAVRVSQTPASAAASLGTVAASCSVEPRAPVDLALEYHSSLLSNR